MSSAGLVAEIVSLLNRPPFSRDLTLVAFDEMSPFDLLSLLNDVFVHLDKRHKVDMRDESQSAMCARMLEFIQIMKYPVPGGPSGSKDFMQRVTMGDRGTVYPLLHYFLLKRPQLEKRAYLAPFLIPIEVPQQMMLDQTVNGVYQQYRAVQKEFSEVHRAYDSMRGSSMAPNELQREIKQLQDEREQLKDKIGSMREKTKEMRGFSEIHEITAGLRKEQEEEARLDERRMEQMAQLSAADQRYEHMSRILEEKQRAAQQTGRGGPDEIIDGLRREVKDVEILVRESLPRQIAYEEERLAKLHAMVHEPPKTEEEVGQLRRHVSMLNQDISRFQQQIERAADEGGRDSNLAMFRKQGALIAKKLEHKQAQLDSARDARDRLVNKVDDLQARVAAAGGQVMPKGQDFKKYAQDLRKKTGTYRSMKKKLGMLQHESVILSCTEAILKSRCANLEEVLASIEKSQGVSGYTTTEASLEAVSSATAMLNQTKGKTLEEISKIVTDINANLGMRKNRLAPQIKRLRGVRSEFQELDVEYQEKRSVFEHTAAGLSAERQRLEQECDRYQIEATQQESQYFVLHSLHSLSKSTQERNGMEEDFKSGDSSLLPNFRTFESFYKNKIEQQQTLNQQLRKQHSNMSTSAPEDRRQRDIFQGLFKLLEGKREALHSGNGQKQGTTALIDEYGGTNIMTLQQDSP